MKDMNGLQYVPEINGVQHSWANLQVVIAGRTITGITKISYKDSQTVENVYGAGVRPVGRGYGRIECEASVTMLRDEVEALRASSDTGRLQDIAPFDIIVKFLPVQGSAIVTHRIRNAQFKEDGVEVSEGDTSNSVELPLIVSHIEWK